MSRYAKLTIGLVAVWFLISLIASSLHLYRAGQNQPPLPLGLAAGVPILIFIAWFSISNGFGEFVLSLSARVLTLVQSWRIAGFVFLVLATYGILPRFFALPAGWGDITIGATATLAALYLADARHRFGFIVWQLLGMADLIMAVLLGTLAGVLDPHGIPTSVMAVLPLSLIPTFAVPLLLILHMICIAQALQWPKQTTLQTAQQQRTASA